MAQYKVPQDVEADDKLLGPFSFRQFVYLLIAGVLIALAVGLFQIFPLLAIIPLPPVLLFAALALPLKKDQPMETYLAAVASYYLKPRNRVWTPGQRESTIHITAPKIVDDSRTRDISGEEATHRLSFLADIVDTGGYAIKGMTSRVNEEIVAEGAQADMFETGSFSNLTNTIARDENARHAEVVEGMKREIEKNEHKAIEGGIVKGHERGDEAETARVTKSQSGEGAQESKQVQASGQNSPTASAEASDEKSEKSLEKDKTIQANPSIMELANNADYSVATIAKEANRIKEKGEGEVFISLH